MNRSGFRNFGVQVGSLIGGAALSTVLLGLTGESRSKLDQAATTFRNLNSEQQHVVRLSLEDLRSQSTERQAEVRRIHEVIRSDAAAQETLDEFDAWWRSLSRDDWDAFQEMTNDARLTFVQSRWEARSSQSTSGSLSISFDKTPAFRLPDLQISHADYWKLISAVVPPSERSTELTKELSRLKSEDQQALRLTLAVFEPFTEEVPATAWPLLNDRMHRLRDELLKIPAANDWATRYRQEYQPTRGGVWESAWLKTTGLVLLGQAAIRLGEDFQKEFPVTEDQMLAAFESIASKSERLELMEMPPAQARARMAALAQQMMEDSPEKQLLDRFIAFEQKRENLIRQVAFGFAPANRANRPFGPRPPQTP